MFSTRDREKCKQLYQKYYCDRNFHDSLYREQIQKYLRSGERLLDAGCGRYMTFCKDLSEAGEVVGIDLESTLDTDNQKHPFGIRGDLGKLPFPSEHFDVVISRSVIEHLTDPIEVFREFARVLRPGARIVVITPNKYDFVSFIAALTPYWVHRRLVGKIFGVPEDDVFPTLYRANAAEDMRKAMAAAGLKEREVEMVNHYPAYLMFSPALFRLDVLYERMTSFGFLRCSLFGVFETSATKQPFFDRLQPVVNAAAR